MQPTKLPVFNGADAWVLAAVAVGGGLKGALLSEIIAAGDLINRTLFTPQQLRSGFAKLLGRGHVAQLGERYVIAGEARVAVVRALQEPFTSFSVLQFFEEFLGASPYGTGESDRDDPEWAFDELTDAMVALAIGEYHAEVASLGQEIRQTAGRG